MASIITAEDALTINVTLEGGASRNFVNAGEKFFLNGLDGNTYLLFNSTTSKLELWVNGVLKERWS